MKRNIITAFALSALALTASAQYKVVVTTVDGEKTEFATSGIENIRFEEAPAYMNINQYIGGEYSSKGDNGIYFFSIGSAAPDADGLPPQIGDVQISMVLTSDLSESYLDAAIPAGTFKPGTGAQKGEFDVQKSALWLRLTDDPGQDGVTVSPIVDGTVDVSREGEIYNIKFELTILSGETIAVLYTGKMEFAPGTSENEQFTEDVDIEFIGGQEHYYANWAYPFCDDATLEFYTGEFTPDGAQIEGYWFHIPIFMPDAPDAKNPEQYLPDGVYTVEPRDQVWLYTNLPFTFQKGADIDLWGTIYPSGTYLTYLDKSGRVKLGYITGGSFTVSNQGTKIEFDLLTDNGIKVKGSYNGAVNLDDKYSGDIVIEGTIEDDIEFNFIPETVGISYPMGDYIKAGVNQFIVMITDPYQEHGDFLTVELSSDQQILPDGTYTINNEIAPFCGVKGFLDYGKQPIFSWFGNLDDVDENGVQNIVAPIMGGTLTFSTPGEGTRKIEFDLLDEDGHHLTGIFEGPFFDAQSASGVAKKKNVLKRPAEMPAKPKFPVIGNVRL